MTDDVTRGITLAIENYVSRRAPVSHFVRALIANNLLDCCAYCPQGFTMDQLRACERVVFNKVPGRARGSDAAVSDWIANRTPAPEPAKAAEQ